MEPQRLDQFPFVRVRLACLHCPHKHGDYSLARLAERYGADAPLDDVLHDLTRACKWQVPPGTKRRKYVPYCRAHYVDLYVSGRPHDLPPEDELPDDEPPLPPMRPRLRIVE